MGCGCQPGAGNHWDAYIACAQVAPQPLAPDSVLQQYGAQAGGKSSDFTLCYAVAECKTRRSIYWKANPGDCGAPGAAINQTTMIEAKVGQGLSSAASVDPEPISNAILTGAAALFGGFTAAHAAAVANEETVNCNVATTWNWTIEQLEQAVKAGVYPTDQAATVLTQVQQQLDAVLARISKPVNFSYGARIGLQAMVNFMRDIGFASLAPSSPIAALLPSAPVASPGAPGTYQTQNLSPMSPSGQGMYPVPAAFPSTPSTYAGASGFISTPLTGNNQGAGITAAGSAGISIPNNLPVGTLVLIGGVLYLVTRPGSAAAAA